MSNLKQSVPDWCFFRENTDPGTYYQALRNIGYQAVEMVAPERRGAALKAGLKILNVTGPGMENGINRIENHGTLVPEISKCIKQAQEHNIPHLIILSGNRTEQPDSQGLANCISAVKQLAPEAEKAGVILTFEMLNSFEHPNYQADNSSYGFDLAKEVNSPAVKVLYDIWHMYRMGEDIPDSILPNLGLVAHIHVAGSPGRKFPGTSQDIDYAALVKKIHNAGYRGYWGQEFIPEKEPLDELEQAFELFQSYHR